MRRFLTGFAVGIVATLGGLVAVGHYLAVEAPLAQAAALGPRCGFVGVDVFFVCSGFLITALLLQEQVTRGRVRLLAFYRRRAIRLLPALALFVTGWAAYSTVTSVPTAKQWGTIASVGLYALGALGELLVHASALAPEAGVSHAAVQPVVVAVVEVVGLGVGVGDAPAGHDFGAHVGFVVAVSVSAEDQLRHAGA